MSAQITLKKLSQKMQYVFAEPPILTELWRAINDPGVKHDTLAQIIKNESGFTRKILTLAHSVYVDEKLKITNLPSALAVLGVKRIYQLALYASVNEFFNFGTNTPIFSGYALWKHSVGVGLCAKLIARRLHCVNAEDFFPLGILHDVGFILEYHFYQKAFLTLLSRLQEKPAEIISLEQELIGTDHAELTKVFFEKWNLSQSLKQVLLYHHKPWEIECDLQRDASILYLANDIIKKKKFGFTYQAAEETNPKILPMLHLTPLELREVSEDFDQAAGEVSQLLELVYAEPR